MYNACFFLQYLLRNSLSHHCVFKLGHILNWKWQNTLGLVTLLCKCVFVWHWFIIKWLFKSFAVWNCFIMSAVYVLHWEFGTCTDTYFWWCQHINGWILLLSLAGLMTVLHLEKLQEQTHDYLWWLIGHKNPRITSKTPNTELFKS